MTGKLLQKGPDERAQADIQIVYDASKSSQASSAVQAKKDKRLDSRRRAAADVPTDKCTA